MGVKSLSERNVTLLQRTESLNLGKREWGDLMLCCHLPDHEGCGQIPAGVRKALQTPDHGCHRSEEIKKR